MARLLGVTLAALILAACSSNNTTTIITAAPTSASAPPTTATADPSSAAATHAIDIVCASLQVITPLVNKDLNLGPNEIQDAVKIDLGFLEDQINKHAAPLEGTQAGTDAEALLTATENVTEFSGIGGADEYRQRLRTCADTALAFSRSYCKIL